VTETAQGKNPL